MSHTKCYLILAIVIICNPSRWLSSWNTIPESIHNAVDDEVQDNYNIPHETFNKRHQFRLRTWVIQIQF